ncbi:tyrosine-type recombinase/integrase [Orbus mooreae]|uniref:tyrosine-type recombinase/integrase n=1 Tax=Orbus mooreae TaxID=3074107 RepID=UPI00370D54A1
MALTEIAVRNAKPKQKRYTLNDDEGLSLCVAPCGGKYWHFRFSWQGKQPRISLGTYPDLSLKEARLKRDDYRLDIAKGIDPRPEHRRNAQANIEMTDEEGYETHHKTSLTLEMFIPRWKALKFKKLGIDDPTRRNSTKTQIERYLKKDILPTLGIIPIEKITLRDIQQVLRKVENRGALSIAEKLRCWLIDIFRHAMLDGLIQTNPTTDIGFLALPKPAPKNNAHLDMKDIPQFLVALSRYPGDIQTKLALKLLLLTGVRPGELRFSKPEQFDLDNQVWTIPAGEIKQFKRLVNAGHVIPDYVIPLSRQAVNIVRELLSLRYASQPYLLRGRGKPYQPVCENTFNQGIKRLGYDKKLTSHGLRGTLSTALYELDYEGRWIEAQLSHQDKNQIRRAYNHAKYITQRQRMMQEWADLLDEWQQLVQ